MAAFTASAPCKAILFGEHYVVYGSPALAIAIGPRNRVKFSAWGGDGIALKSDLGDGVISPSGEYEGPDALGIFSTVAGTVFGDAPIQGASPPVSPTPTRASGSSGPLVASRQVGAPQLKMLSCTAEFFPGWNLKGVGTSASFCAAFAAGLFKLAGKKATTEGIFSAAQSGDMVAHGGRASGIDAKTVSFGGALVFQRSFSPPKFGAEKSSFKLPSGCSLLLIDTFKGKKDGTGKMLEIFAGQFGINGTPMDASEAQRQKIREEYAALWEKVSPALKKTDAETLGSLMNENHALLKKRKMSSSGIGSAISAALSSGAYGAKITGGGGEGGAVLALCGKKNLAAIASSVSSSTGFACHEISLAAKGAGVD